MAAGVMAWIAPSSAAAEEAWHRMDRARRIFWAQVNEDGRQSKTVAAARC